MMTLTQEVKKGGSVLNEDKGDRQVEDERDEEAAEEATT